MSVLIYGGTGGIGAATARSLKLRGISSHLVARSQETLQNLSNELGCSYTLGDILDPTLFQKAAQDASQSTGDIAGLVYAIGTINLKPMHRLSAQEVTHDFQVNALGALQAVQAALEGLKAYEKNNGKPASIVLFSTVAVAQGFTAHASVSMAKGAVEGLALSLATELAPKIRVNCIAPSLTQTPLAKGLTSNEAMATAIAQMHALPRLGQPEDIAPLAAFLLSDEASWMTGQIIGVDGGRSTLRTKG